MLSFLMRLRVLSPGMVDDLPMLLIAPLLSQRTRFFYEYSPGAKGIITVTFTPYISRYSHTPLR